MNDKAYMLRALALARKGRYTARPNPCVGCVIVKDDQIVGTGWHHRCGEAHAEVLALREAGNQAQAATMYVTLEPCSHHGRTPPCCDALIDAGIARVICATSDPSAKVNGKGFERLRAHGIEVTTGVLREESEALNRGFFSVVHKDRPWIRIKTASTIDGRTALESGESAWISGEDSRYDVQFWRASSGALMTGQGTVITDNPRLNVRLSAQELGSEEEVQQPLRVVVDSYLKTSPQAKIYAAPGTAVVATVTSDEKKCDTFRQMGIEIWHFPTATKRVPLDKLFQRLAEHQINEVQVEAGAGLVGALIEAGLYDEILLYITPNLFGSGYPLATISPIATMKQRHELVWHTLKRIDNDLRILLKPTDRSYV